MGALKGGSLQTPMGFMRSLKGAFTKTKKKGGTSQLYGLKSHDWHKVLQVSNIFFVKACDYDVGGIL